jgi:hypothetical protein
MHASPIEHPTSHGDEQMTDRVKEREQQKDAGSSNSDNGLDLVSLSQQKDSNERSIGVASIEKDGTLHLRLKSSGPGPSGEAHFVYKTTDKDYADVLKHIGTIKPGEFKPVRPWSETAEKK